MASSTEIQINQREKLFDFLELEKMNEGITIVGLKQKIIKLKATMAQEDISHVEKMIEKL